MRCKVLDKWEEMNTLETVKKEIVVYAVMVHIMANALKKHRSKKHLMNSKHVLVRFLEKWWCPCRYYHDAPFSTEILALSGLYFILTHNLCLIWMLLSSPQHLSLCPCRGRLIGWPSLCQMMSYRHKGYFCVHATSLGICKSMYVKQQHHYF